MRRVLLVVALALVWPSAAQAQKQYLPLGISYGPNAEEVLNVFPAQAPGAATVVLVHGGGWRVQRLRTERSEEAEELQEQGFTVFNIDYPQDTPSMAAFPLEPEAIENAIRYARAHAALYDGNPENIVLLGGSAGGNLVELAAEQIPVRAVIALSGPSNLRALLEQKLKVEKIGEDVEQALGCLESACSPSFAEEWSPALHVSLCPVWQLYSSKGDPVPLSQAQGMLGALRSAGCTANLTVLGGGKHAFEYWPQIRHELFSFIREE
jgi:acetyl esterase/lipase